MERMGRDQDAASRRETAATKKATTTFKMIYSAIHLQLFPPASVSTKPTQQQQQQQQPKPTDSFDFSAPTPRDFAPPAVAAALYSQTSSGGFFSDGRDDAESFEKPERFGRD